MVLGGATVFMRCLSSGLHYTDPKGPVTQAITHPYALASIKQNGEAYPIRWKG